MAKISFYKFINPGGAGADKMSHNAGRSGILALNRLGSTVNGIASVVGDMGGIAKAKARVERLTEKAQRRRDKRDRDQRAEDEMERRNALMGKGINTKPKIKKKTKKGFGEQFLDKILNPIFGMFRSIFGWMAEWGTKLAMYEGLQWLADPKNKPKIELFLHKLHVVFTKIANFVGGRIGNIMDGFTALFGSGSTLGERLKGLGELIVGLGGMALLLNPFGMMDAILSLLGWDWYRDKPDGRRGKPGKPGSTQPRRTQPRWDANRSNINREFGKNGLKEYNKLRSRGASHKSALKQLRKLKVKNPDLFKSPKPTSGLKPSGAPKGKIIKPGAKPGLGKVMNRTTLKFLGPSATKGVKSVFKNVFGRIPFFGAALTTLFSLMMGEPLDQALWKGGGAAIGGALGTLIPIPGVGSLVGMLVGEYVGDLMYTMFKGDGTGGIRAVGDRLKQDIKGVFNQIGNLINWVKKGFSRLYEGLPKWQIPELPKWLPKRDWIGKHMLKGLPGMEIPNPLWLINPLNSWDKAKLVASSFFGDSAIPKGKVEKGAGDPGAPEKDVSESTSGVDARERAKQQNKTPITNKRGRIVGWKDNETGEITKDETTYESDPNKRQMGRSAAKNRINASNLINEQPSITPQPEKKSNNQWWDFLDLFPNKESSVPAGSFGSGSKETIESSPGSAVDTNIGRHTTGSSKDQPKTEKKGSSWWNPFSWGKMDGGKVMGRIPPRLTNKQYFFGKIFKGISKVVSGVVKGVSNVVSSIASSPILGTIMQIAPIVFPAAAPFIYAGQAAMSLAQGNIMGAIAPAMGALGGFFPGTFGAGSAIGKFMSSPVGKIGMGFLEGGVQGALGAGMNFLGGKLSGTKFGNFLSSGLGQTLGTVAAGLIPGMANIPGMSQLFGMESFGDGPFGVMGIMQNLASQNGMGGMFKAISGMVAGGDFIGGLRELAPELGIDPRVLGVFDRSSSMFSTSKGGGSTKQLSQEYAMQTALEFVPVPMLIEKLIEIPKPVPINNPIPVPVPRQG